MKIGSMFSIYFRFFSITRILPKQYFYYFYLYSLSRTTVYLNFTEFHCSAIDFQIIREIITTHFPPSIVGAIMFSPSSIFYISIYDHKQYHCDIIRLSSRVNFWVFEENGWRKTVFLRSYTRRPETPINTVDRERFGREGEGKIGIG